MTAKSFAIIEAPSVLGLVPKGVETLPNALLKAGLAKELKARLVGCVEPASYNPEKDPETGVLNAQSIADYSIRLADAVGACLDAGERPVVLGGDCSILLGNLLALRRRGRYGLLFMDGHADFYQPEAEPNGEAASMDLALATGRGPSIVTNLEGLAPLVRDEDTVAVGRRDLKDTEEYGSQRIEESGICVIDFNMIQTVGATAAARQAIDWLEQTPIDGFWLHLDADVLDDRIMPAVDYRMPGGLSYEDLTTFLSASMATGRVVGINITILNPKLDHDGTITRMFAKVLWDGLAQLPEPV